MGVRTEDELRAAIDSMCRIRAVERPPDARGVREIWHQGAKGAELLTWVDAQGVVTRHELAVFEDYVAWERGRGLSTGLVQNVGTSGARASETIAWDQDLKLSSARLERVLSALGGYSGQDPFILSIKNLLQRTHELEGGSHDAGPVTRPSMLVTEELQKARQLAGPEVPRRRPLVWALGLVLSALGVAVALVLLLRK